MKHARVLWQGKPHGAVPAGDGIVLDNGTRLLEDEVQWLAPLTFRTIFALGLNYADHAKELALTPPDEPLLFLKGPNTLIGHRRITQRPADASSMHCECELGVVIGAGGKHIPRDRAYDHVAGYTVANDYTIRDDLENYERPNLRAKNRDSCTPIGPWLVDAGDVRDPMNLALRTTVNGKLAQQGNTRDMVFDIPALIEYLSAFMSLSTGDLILTGTPAGVVDCKVGDEVITEIEGIGRLVNTIARRP
jgi:5-oxopent-3-ene-1,2,5-tricarboxylate decarboxylase / 2-hydroxyhepta-2,4-diene-1,7-dioate isomerase